MAFLGRKNWKPDGFVSKADEQVQEYYTRAGSLPPALAYAYSLPSYGGQADMTGNEIGWIPTETEIGSAIALRNMAEVSGGATPVQVDDPQQNQILQSLYASTAAFWEDIRRASGTES